MKQEVLVLREAEIRSLLDPAACIEAVEASFSAYATGQAELPNVINLDVPEYRGEIHIKAGHLRGGPYYAVKIASGFPGNLALDLPANDGMVLVFDVKTGAPAAFLLDNGFVTDLRTAAAGAVVAKHLARKHINTLAVVGSGVQARYQVRLLNLVRSFREVRIWGRNRSKAEECVRDLLTSNIPGNPGLHVANTVEQAVNKADVVITVTASRAPLLNAEWLSPGTLVIAVGSDGPDKQELNVGVLARADRIVADSLPQCLRLGEIHHAVEQAAISKEKISTELGEITAGLKPGRTSDTELIVCDLTGVGVQDVAAASLVMRRALTAGIGERLVL
jgi:ornithine cyclodeaminase